MRGERVHGARALPRGGRSSCDTALPHTVGQCEGPPFSFIGKVMPTLGGVEPASGPGRQPPREFTAVAWSAGEKALVVEGS